MKPTPLSPIYGVLVQNDNEETIPPRSVVVVTSVEYVQETETQESNTITHVDQFNGQAGAILVTGSAPIQPGAMGQAFFDLYIYVAIETSIPSSSSSSSISMPLEGAEWGPVAGQWTIGPSGSGFIALGDQHHGCPPIKARFYRTSNAGQSEGGGGSGAGGCGCCDCFDCIPLAQATVGGCDAAPNGAAFQYSFPMGVNPFSDNGGTSANVTFTYCQAQCVGSSSSSSSTGGFGDCGCSWYSCPVSICQPNTGSSSSSSSSLICGTYQLILTMSLDDDDNTVETISISFMGIGTDWMATGS